MKIALGSDHAGYTYKEALIKLLKEKNIDTLDLGPFTDTAVDYPDYAHPIAEAIVKKTADLGILICGSGNGVAIAANKHIGVRAALCWQPEIAQLAKAHNDANILCLPARFVSLPEAKEIVEMFIDTPFAGGRHCKRVDKINGI